MSANPKQPWPSTATFRDAVQHPQDFFQEPALKQCQPVFDKRRRVVLENGTFGVVFMLRSPSGQYKAVKCFTTRLEERAERYRAIDEHLRKSHIPAAIAFEYLPQGIRIRGTPYPILKMPWCDGVTLNRFVEQSLANPASLHVLFDRWVELMRQLRAADIAHGDLQHENVLVEQSAGGLSELKLVDFDGMFVPTLTGRKAEEAGHPDYQHPRRLNEMVCRIEVDNFPSLVIACAVRALSVEGKTLWTQYDNGNNLLFRAADFASPQTSVLLQQLWKSRDPVTKFLAGHIILSTDLQIGAGPFLPELVKVGVTPVVSDEDAKAIEAILKRPPAKHATSPKQVEGAARVGGRGVAGIVSPTASNPANVRPLANTSTQGKPAFSAQSGAVRSTVSTSRQIQPHSDSTWQWVLSIVALCLVILLIGQRWRSPSLPASRVEEIKQYELPATTIPSLGMEMLKIPAGEFMMGTDVHIPQGTVRIGSLDGDNAEIPAHPVTIGHEYELGKYAVTQSEWASVMKSKPWQDQQYVREGDRFPATYISWLGAVTFCNEVSRSQGLPEYYAIADEESVTIPDLLGNGYRLPTEAEWEYACRGGTKTLWSFRDDERPRDYAWFGELTPEGIANISSFSGENTPQYSMLRNQSELSSEVQLRPGAELFAQEVGRKKPNPFGLFDMHGNVDQWCWDWYDEYLPGPVTDPSGPSQGRSRVQRGGRWDWYLAVTRSAYRSMAPPSYRGASTGFRVARTSSLSNLSKPPTLASRSKPGKRVSARTTVPLPPVSVEMKLIPAGEFRMGSPMTRAANSPEFGRVIFDDALRSQNEGPQHAVQNTSPFYMGVYEVTQEQYSQVMGKNPSLFSPRGRFAVRVEGKDTQQFPVESVSWYDAIDFCNKLSERNGHVANYQMEHVERAEGSIVSATVTMIGSSGFRLPTEAEWEYACRASTTTPYHYGIILDFDTANFEGNSAYGTYSYHKSDKGRYFGRPTSVGSYPPNAFGLHDMHGNVYEWCWDWADDSFYSTFESNTAVDPIGPVSGTERIARGGGFDSSAQATRSAFRGNAHPSHSEGSIGFRVARTP